MIITRLKLIFTIAGALAIAGPATAQTASSNVASRAAELAQLDAERAREVAEARRTGPRTARPGARTARTRTRSGERPTTTAASRRWTQSRWDRAVTAFDRVIEGEGTQGRRGPLLEGLRAEQAGAAPRSARHDRGAARRPIRRAATCRMRRRSKSKCGATPGSRCDPRTRATRR